MCFLIKLNPARAALVAELTDKYRTVSQIVALENRTATSQNNSGSVLGLAVRAQLYLLHPKLVPPKVLQAEDYQADKIDLANSTSAQINQKYKKDDKSAAEKRKLWLQELSDSIHLKTVVNFLAYIYEHDH